MGDRSMLKPKMEKLKIQEVYYISIVIKKYRMKIQIILLMKKKLIQVKNYLKNFYNKDCKI